MGREETKAVGMVKKMNVKGKEEEEETKKETVGYVWEWYEGFVCVCVEDVENLDEWRFRTIVVDLK